MNLKVHTLQKENNQVFTVCYQVVSYVLSVGEELEQQSLIKHHGDSG